MRNRCAKLIPRMLRAEWTYSGLLLGCILPFAQPESGFALALGAREGIQLRGNSIQVEGDLVASVNTNAVLDVGNAVVGGHLVAGPDASVQIGQNGSVGDLAWTANTNGIQPGRLHRDMFFMADSTRAGGSWAVVDPSFPAGIGGSGSVSGTNYDHVFTTTGDYSVDDNGSIYVGPDVDVWLKTTATNFGPDRIFVAGTGFTAGRLFIWATGLNLSISADHGTESRDPSNLIIRGTTNCTSVRFKGDGDFIGTVFAPDADLEFESGRNDLMNVTGSWVAKSVVVKGQYYFHGDPAGPVIVESAGPFPDLVVGEQTAIQIWVTLVPFKCQWKFNGTNIPGATNFILMLTNVQLSDAGNYSVRVTGTSSYYDDPAVLTLRVYTSLPATLQPAPLSSNRFQLTVQGPWTRRYSLETSTNLMQWNWLTFVYPPYTLVETNVTAVPQRFYRAVLDRP